MKTDLQVTKLCDFFFYHKNSSVLLKKKSCAVSSFSTDLKYAMRQKARLNHYGIQDGTDFLIIPLNFPMCVTVLAQRPLEKLLL